MKIVPGALGLLVVTPWYWTADWLWGLPLIILTVVVHVCGLLIIDEKIVRFEKDVLERHKYGVVFVVTIGSSAMLAALLHGLAGAIWASAYRLLGALPDYSSAALYSLSAMTTYGQADVVLEKRWQFLGALEALDGLLLFGITTAFLLNIIQKTRALRNKTPH